MPEAAPPQLPTKPLADYTTPPSADRNVSGPAASRQWSTVITPTRSNSCHTVFQIPQRYPSPRQINISLSDIKAVFQPQQHPCARIMMSNGSTTRVLHRSGAWSPGHSGSDQVGEAHGTMAAVVSLAGCGGAVTTRPWSGRQGRGWS